MPAMGPRHLCIRDWGIQRVALSFMVLSSIDYLM